MAFKPETSDRPARGDYESTANLPVPRAGLRKARLSLIIDLGTQEREDAENTAADGTVTTRVQKPCQQLAVYADLTADRVDYGGEIGEAQYRLCINKSFMNKLQGINFTTSSPMDAKGKFIEGAPWGLHARNALTLIAKAVGKPQVAIEGDHADSLDMEALLGEPFMAQVEVSKKEHKDGKKDKDGNVIVFTNVNYKGASTLPDGDDDLPVKVPALDATPMVIGFKTATVDQIKFIRKGVLKQIKLALNYPGSQMQKAIEAYEAANGGPPAEDEKPAPAARSEESKTKAKAAAAKAKAAAPEEEDDDSAPF